MFKLTIMTGHFASEASGPQKLQKYIIRDFYASSLGKKTFRKVRNYLEIYTVGMTRVLTNEGNHTQSSDKSIDLICTITKLRTKNSDQRRQFYAACKILIFSIYVFCGEATKKASIDGLKWRDLVMVAW